MDGNESEDRPERHMTALFFGALFRLGVCSPDWETWYGTRPMEFARFKRRPAAPHDRANQNPVR